MSEEKKETALRTLSKSLRKRFQGPTVNISWIELDAFMMKAQTIEMTHILNAMNDTTNTYLHQIIHLIQLLSFSISVQHHMAMNEHMNAS